MNDDGRLTLSVKECARLLGIGKTLCAELCRSGQIPSLMLGHRRIIVRKQLELWLEQQALPRPNGGVDAIVEPK